MHAIGLADALRAIRASAQEPEQRERVLALLGLRFRQADPVRHEDIAEAQALPTPPIEERTGSPRPPAAPPPDTGGPNRAWLDAVTQAPGGDVPSWYLKTPPLGQDTLPRELRRPVPDDLLPDARRRTLLLALLLRLTEGTELDIDRLVARIAQRQPLLAIPRRRKRAIRRGVQILIDTGERMQPFADDQAHLAGFLRRQLRPDQVRIAYCHGAPPAGGDAEPYPWPAPGASVLLLSDLGQISYPTVPAQASADAWIAFAATLAQRGSRLAVLAPMSPGRIARRLRDKLEVYSWDRALTEKEIQARRRRFAGRDA